jgi:hypothetical protein
VRVTAPIFLLHRYLHAPTVAYMHRGLNPLAARIAHIPPYFVFKNDYDRFNRLAISLGSGFARGDRLRCVKFLKQLGWNRVIDLPNVGVTKNGQLRRMAARGWRLFPVKQRGKKLLIDDWPNQATNDEARLQSFRNHSKQKFAYLGELTYRDHSQAGQGKTAQQSSNPCFTAKSAKKSKNQQSTPLAWETGLRGLPRTFPDAPHACTCAP